MASIRQIETSFPVRLIVVESAPFAENSYILLKDGRDDCVVVDPGFDPQSIIELVEQHCPAPAAILLTHGHADHIAGNASLKSRWPAVPIVIGHAEVDKLVDPSRNLSRGFGIDLVSPPADQTVAEGDSLELAGFRIEIREIPGHSTGHVVYLVRPAERPHEPPIVFAGDVLFRGSVGRTDFPDGDFASLAAGIRGKLYSLPASTLVLPGHGEPTTIGHERHTNPFVPETPRPHTPGEAD